jgi:hypothetical protein
VLRKNNKPAFADRAAQYTTRQSFISNREEALDWDDSYVSRVMTLNRARFQDYILREWPVSLLGGLFIYRGADKSLARPGRKQATATEDFDVHISCL